MTVENRSSLTFAALALLALVPALAGADEKPVASQVTIVGENYCLGCALKKDGAAAQCSKYGHRHGLRVEKASDAKGVEVPDLKGRTLSYLENDKSEKLFKGEAFHKQRVEVKGRLFSKESMVEVREFKAP